MFTHRESRGYAVHKQFVLAVLGALAGLQAPALADAPPDTKPVSSGAPHVCTKYPAAAIQAHAEGMTVLAFRVGIDGSIKDLTVSKSSGNSHLDEASVACAQNWHYKPATLDGMPVEVPWQASVNWSLGEHVMAPSPVDCAKFLPPGTAAASGVTKVSFGFGEDGSSQHVTVAKSSGNDVLDRAALSCVAAMKTHFATRPPPSYFRVTTDVDWAKELAPPE
jgi:TonB family protein